MKSNNKLQYLQKLATKNQQQQNPGRQKPSQSNNLVGIGQSASNPYAQGPRFGSKQVRHQPKNQVSAELSQMTTSQSVKKFSQNKKGQQRSQVVISKDYVSASMEINDPQMDQFESLQVEIDAFDDEGTRKNNRRKQMNRRKQKILKGTAGILKNKDPSIRLDNVDDSERKKRPRQQVSISEQPRLPGSPGKNHDSRNRLPRKLKRNQSDDNSQNSLQIGQNPRSELTVSSAGKHPDLEDDNSIISEEDSAFEDQTPAAKKSNLKANKNADFTMANIHVQKERGDHSQSRISHKKDETVIANLKDYNRQRTLGWKQNNHDTTRWPFKRSPTHKSRNGNDEVKSSGSKKKFALKVHQSKKPQEKGFTQQSRHSSLNYTMDHQMDQLSVNMNKNLIFTKGGNQMAHNGNTSNQETQSVASVITKGGTVVSPFGKKNSNGMTLAQSHSKASATHKSYRGTKKDTKLMKGEHNIDLQGGDFVASKTHVRFGEDINDEDVRRSYYKNNQKMINIYLKTPYKVLTIDQIKIKEKVERERDFMGSVNLSPDRLYHAENNLKIHTLFREKQNYATTKGGKFKKDLIYVSGDEDEGSQTFKQKSRKTGFSTTNKKKMFKDQSISQISDTKDEYESVQQIESQDMVSDNNLIQLTSSQLKQLKNQKNQLEIEFKKKFYNQLQNQLERRIEQVKYQTNALAKQKNLFAIYGNTATISPEAHRSILNNLSIETIQQGVDLDEQGSSNDKKFKALQAQQRQYKHNTAAKHNESRLSRAESPSKMDSVGNSVLKGSISRQKEPPLVKQSTGVSKYSRLSENEFPTNEPPTRDPINEQDQIDDDERIVRVTGMSYDFEQEASLKKLLSMSNTLGYSSVQIRDLRLKQKQLEEAEKKLQLQKASDSMVKGPHNTSGTFVISKERQPKKNPPKFVSHTRSKTDKKPLKRNKLSMIQERESMVRQMEAENGSNDDNVKDYFDNKISLRRSIEKKLHYESKISHSKAAGVNYQTSAQKHQQLLADLKNIKKEREDAYNSKIGLTDQSSYADMTPNKGHHRIKTVHGSLKPDSTLPEIINTGQYNESNGSLRKLKSNVKDEKNSPSPLESETFFPLKKSGTQNEKKKNLDVGYSPIRMKRNNVLMAYNIQTTNPQFLASVGPNNHTELRNNSSSKKQLGFQFMNKSPRPSVLSNGMHKDPSFSFEKESPQKITSTSKFISAKQTQLMKGVLSNGRKNRKNKDLMGVNEASNGRLPAIHQSSSYAPGV